MLYEKSWKILMWITIAFLVISIALLANNIVTKGSFLQRDVDLSGGKVITVQVQDADTAKIKSAIPDAIVSVTSGITKNLRVEIPFESNETDVIAQLKTLASFSGEPSVQVVGPTLGEIFFQQAQTALIIAFILMAITVFIVFRTVVPSSIVVLCALTDTIGTIAVLSIINVELSLPVIAALLTLIGYSVDTDILLTSELLKTGSTDYKAGIKKAAKTGITMTLTALVALLAMYFISGSAVIEQIALVLVIGLVIDIPATWLTNAGVLRMWLERREKKRGLK